MVFFGHDGLDELTTTDVSTVRELRDGEVHRTVLDPLDLGLARRRRARSCGGGDAADNAAIARRVLDGEKGAVATSCCSTRPPRSWSPTSPPTLAAGLEAAPGAIDSGARPRRSTAGSR